MSAEDLKKLFKEAAEIAAAVPKELREAAFNRALDALSVPSGKRGRTPASANLAPNPRLDDASQDSAATLLQDLDRTLHPEVSNAARVLDRALFVLQAARDDHQIDGLTSPQIAKVLTEKFRLRTTRQAVTQALDAAGDKVDRNASGRAAVYRIMHAGDQYLATGDFSSTASSKSRRSTRKQNRNKTPKKSTKSAAKAKATTKRVSKANSSSKKATKSGRPGPGAMLRNLATAGFFSKPRTIAEIQSYAQHQLAHSYELNELSTPLRRTIHSKLLVRTQNDDGQYEYTAV